MFAFKKHILPSFAREIAVLLDTEIYLFCRIAHHSVIYRPKQTRCTVCDFVITWFLMNSFVENLTIQKNLEFMLIEWQAHLNSYSEHRNKTSASGHEIEKVKTHLN